MHSRACALGGGVSLSLYRRFNASKYSARVKQRTGVTKITDSVNRWREILVNSNKGMFASRVFMCAAAERIYSASSCRFSVSLTIFILSLNPTGFAVQKVIDCIYKIIYVWSYFKHSNVFFLKESTLMLKSPFKLLSFCLLNRFTSLFLLDVGSQLFSGRR